MKVLILQRVIPTYRVALFRELTANKGHAFSFLIGRDLTESKAQNSRDLSRIEYVQLPANAIGIGGRVLTWHVGLLSAIRRARPDVIVCEAESHVLGYLTAIFYKLCFSPNTNLLLWCFFSLPGITRERTRFHAIAKTLARRQFSGFISYSSFGKLHLMSKGIPEDKITVAVNVCDTSAFIERDRSLELSKEQAKHLLGVENRFVVSYIGTLDEVKKPEVVIALAER